MIMDNLNIATEVNAYGYIADNKIYLNPFLDYKARQIGEVKISNADTFNYFENRFTLFTQKVNELFNNIDNSDNKGSFLQKLLHLKDSCGTYEALGDFKSIYNKLCEKEIYLNELIAINRVKNLEIKNAILQELEDVKNSSDWINAAEIVKEIKVKWIRVGSVDKNISEEIEKKYSDALGIFYSRRQVFFDERNALSVLRLAKYKEIKEKSQLLLHVSNIKEAFDTYKKYQEEWKKVGIVPKSELSKFMIPFKNVGNQLFKKLKENKSNRVVLFSKDFVNNIDKLKAISENIKQILLKLPPKGDEEVKLYQAEWKAIGYVKDPEFKELDSGFKRNCARIMDLYFMRKLCNKRHPGFFKMSLTEQLVIQIGVLKELIARDSEVVENFENSYVKPDTSNGDSSYDTIFGAKLNMQKRGLETKKSIVIELEEKYRRISV
ncbi:MAG: DUF349 domain-containing protein [Cytophagales bacterium]|nr:MAG: DUF349 domain-containing protein [Cytophagales bacterium]